MSTYSEAAQHGIDGTREIASANYEGTVFACLCGEKRENLGELLDHVNEAGRDVLAESLASLETTAMRIKSERDRYKADAEHLLEALKTIESCLSPEDNDFAAQKVRAAIKKAEANHV
jgi:hypothetical protein